METGAFSAPLHEAKRPCFQSHEAMLMCGSCFCQLITGVLSFRCCLSWHAELSKGPMVEMRPCFPPPVWSSPGGLAGNRCHGPVDVDLLLWQSCSQRLLAGWQVCFDILASVLVPLPFPLPQAILRNITGAKRHELAVPKLWVICRSLPDLEVGGKGVWIYLCRNFLHKAFPVLFTKINSLLKNYSY